MNSSVPPATAPNALNPIANPLTASRPINASAPLNATPTGARTAVLAANAIHLGSMYLINSYAYLASRSSWNEACVMIIIRDDGVANFAIATMYASLPSVRADSSAILFWYTLDSCAAAWLVNPSARVQYTESNSAPCANCL